MTTRDTAIASFSIKWSSEKFPSDRLQRNCRLSLQTSRSYSLFAIITRVIVLFLVTESSFGESYNPFDNGNYTRWYVNPIYQEKARQSINNISGADNSTRENLMKYSNKATAQWVNGIQNITASTINDTASVEGILRDALLNSPGSLVALVIHNAPNKDCATTVTPNICCYWRDGECDFDPQDTNDNFMCDDGIVEYITFLDKFTNVLANFSGEIPIAIVIEPQSLPNLITGAGNCGTKTTHNAYQRAINEAGTMISERCPDCYMYLDAGHGGWLGWHIDSFVNVFITELWETYKTFGDKFRGFATNIGNFQPLGTPCSGKQCPPFDEDSDPEDPCCEDPCGLLASWNPGNNEYNYIQALHDKFEENAENFLPRFIIDTSRNGRPDSRMDCSNWCNIRRASVGEQGLSNASEIVDALFWLTVPGNSDGCSEYLPGSSNACPSFDPMCASQDSIHSPSHLEDPLAPENGLWFDFYFKKLVINTLPPKQHNDTRGEASRTALSKLYRSAGGKHWATATSWLEGDTYPCTASWYGVKGCDSETENGYVEVTELNLPSNNLRGYLPTELGLLTQLVSGFDVSGNSLNGSLPSQFGNFKNIWQNLRVSSNYLTGRLPTEFGELASLKHDAKFSFNDFSFSIPSEFGRWTSMTANLWLDHNGFNESIPTQMGSLSLFTIKYRVDENSLQGKIPSELGLLTGLTSYLQLNSNRLSGGIPTEFGQLTAIDRTSPLFLQANSLSKTLPSQLGCLTSVTALYVQQNDIKSSIPTEIGMMQNTEQLFLSKNTFYGSIPTEIGMFRETVKILALDDNNLEGDIPNSICGFSSLTIFDVSSNKFTGTLFPGDHSCDFPALEIFRVSHNSFNGRLPSTSNWTSLKYNLMHYNAFQGGLSSLVEAATNQTLLALTLHHNVLNEKLPENTALPPTLQTFTINGNRIPGKLPKMLFRQLSFNHNTSILINNNRLSCKLPKFKQKGSLGASSLILVGNLFSSTKGDDIPNWVYKKERQNDFLHTITKPDLSSLRFPPWFDVTVELALMSFVVAMVLLKNKDLFQHKERSSEVAYIRWCALVARRFVFVFTLLLLSMYFLFAKFGNSFYECGDGLLKFTTSAYIHGASTLEAILACLFSIYTIALVITLQEFDRSPSRNEKGSVNLKHNCKTNTDRDTYFQWDEQGGETANVAEENIVESRDVIHEDGSEDKEKDEYLEEEDRLDDKGEEKESRLNVICAWLLAALIVLRDFFVCILIGGLPTVLYVITYQLPKDNILYGNIHPLWVEESALFMLTNALALYLSIVNAFGIPRGTSFSARCILRRLKTAGVKEKHYHIIKTVLAIVVRTCLNILVPSMATLMFADGCNRNWMKLWSRCQHGKTDFDTSADIPYLQYYDQDTEENVYGNIITTILDRKSVCDMPYTEETCARATIGIVGELLIKKMIYAVLFSAFEPQFDTLYRWFNQRYFNRRMKRTEPDIMQRFIWFESCLVFGALIPLLLPLLALQLHVDARVFEWRQRKFLSEADNTDIRFRVRRHGMQCHFILVLILHSALLTFFYMDSNLNARWPLLGILIFIVTLSLYCVGRRFTLISVIQRTWQTLVGKLYSQRYPELEEPLLNNKADKGHSSSEAQAELGE